MNIVFMSMDTLPSTLWARDLYDQMHIRSDFRKWFPRMCQYGFVEGRDYEFVPRVRPQDEGGRTVQRYVKDYRITLEIGYIYYEAPEEEQNFSTLLEFINASEAREDDEEFKNPVDELFEDLEKAKPEHFAVRQYKKYKLAAGDVCSK